VYPGGTSGCCLLGRARREPLAQHALGEPGHVGIEVLPRDSLKLALQRAYTRAVADHMFRNYDGVLQTVGGLGDKAAYDPRAWGRAAEAAMAARVADACAMLRSSGRTLAARVTSRRERSEARAG
jgi:hypothetical protein